MSTYTASIIMYRRLFCGRSVSSDMKFVMSFRHVVTEIWFDVPCLCVLF